MAGDEGYQDGLDELPENVPPGFLGETPVDLRRTETYEHGMNAGITQEESNATRALWVVLLLAAVVTQPLAWWLLWRTRRVRTWVKAVVTLLGLVWAGAIVWSLASGRALL
ncbi:MAG: hypothetical protein C0418_06235 [Coriobacteriaceae bacterium]|nr:hypothetical protein [Coriobacteriaceae bacterium]